jgi:hypothetical protein
MSDCEEIVIKKKVKKVLPDLNDLTMNLQSLTLKEEKDVKENVKEKNIELNYEELMVENNGGISYIIKKYKHKSIISIYEAKYKDFEDTNEDKKPEKGRLILVKWYKNFYGENGTFLFELKGDKHDPYKYMFIGGELIYEFNLLKDDSFVKFKSILGNSGVTYAHLQGKNNTYFLSWEIKAVKNSLLDYEEEDLYSSFFDLDKSKHKKFDYNLRIKKL